jgi:diadenosine tetraphosphate (Ap4A) HIT family hydrolase
VKLTPEEQKEQEFYRDARFTGKYDGIWQNVGECAFCAPRNKYIFYEENGMFMTVSLYAYIDGHFLIVPRRHVRSVKDLTSKEWAAARKCMYIAKKLIRSVHGVKGMQIVIRDGGPVSQSTVPDHLHIHCIPFDAPDLSVWNFRELRYTPLENAALYQKEAKNITKLAAKFEAKYKQVGKK